MRLAASVMRLPSDAFHLELLLWLAADRGILCGGEPGKATYGFPGSGFVLTSCD